MQKSEIQYVSKFMREVIRRKRVLEMLVGTVMGYRHVSDIRTSAFEQCISAEKPQRA